MIKKCALSIRLCKYKIFQTRVAFLGFAIDEQGLNIAFDNIKSILKWLVQKN